MKEYVPPLEIAAESFMNNSGETILTLYGDHGVPDVIVCDGKRYTEEQEVDRDWLLMLADDLDASYPWDLEQAISTMEEIAQLIREACGIHEEQ